MNMCLCTRFFLWYLAPFHASINPQCNQVIKNAVRKAKIGSNLLLKWNVSSIIWGTRDFSSYKYHFKGLYLLHGWQRADTNLANHLPYGTVPCSSTQLMIVHLNCKLGPIGCQLHNVGFKEGCFMNCDRTHCCSASIKHLDTPLHTLHELKASMGGTTMRKICYLLSNNYYFKFCSCV